GLSGAFVEFFGPGVITLSVGERAVVANMAPEYGAQTAYFPVDSRSLDYLRATGRPEALIERVELYCRRNRLWFDPEAVLHFTDIRETDLNKISIRSAGPSRPQDLIAPADARGALDALAGAPSSRGAMHGAVAIAAITSCTNTTDPRLLIAAGILARK